MASCSLCLEIDVEVSMFQETEAFKHLQLLLIKQGFEPLNSTNTICYLCKHLIYKQFLFLKRIWRAQAVKRDVLKQHKSAKTYYNTLKKLNRSELNLSLNLSCNSLPSLYIGVKEENDNDMFQYEPSPIDIDIKEEPDFNYEIKLEKQVPSKNSNRKLQKNKKKNATPVDIDIDDKKIQDKSKHEVAVDALDLEKLEDCDIHYELVLEKTENKEEDVKPQKKKYYKKYKYKPRPVEIMPTKLRRKQTKQTIKTDVTDSDDDEYNEKTKEKHEDDEYIPDKLESESDESPDNENKSGRRICYDGNGKRLKVPNESERQYPMECEECGYEIPSALKHFHHYLIDHKDKEYPYKKPGKYVCQHCGVVKTIHTGEKPFKCHICGAGFAHLGNVRVHIRANHQGVPLEIKTKKRPTKRKSSENTSTKRSKLRKVRKSKKSANSDNDSD